MLISLQRGALQGLRAYGPVGTSIVLEGLGRLLCALLLVGAGMGVTGAMLGTPMAFALVAIGLEVVLHRRVGPVRKSGDVRSLRGLIGDGWVGILGLFLLAALQNMDVIVAKHTLASAAAGSYAAAAVAAKSVVWVAIGIGLHLLPEATRRAAAGLDPRAVLLRALGILVAISAPALLIFAAVPDLLLRLAFGPGLTQAAGALLLLGAAMTLLAVAYLTVQYMVALGETRFLWVLGVIALVEPFLLAFTNRGVVGFAGIVFAVQCVAASSVLVLGLRARRVRAAGAA
jgi:O-antigen/teichoic acid export membrane protein